MKKNYNLLIFLIMILALSANLIATDYIVSGAGSSEVNGTYVETGTQNGKPYYQFDNNGTPYAIGYTTYWIIGKAILGPGFYNPKYYENQTQSDTPPESGWTIFNGQAPAPTVTVGEAGQFLFYISEVSDTPLSGRPAMDVSFMELWNDTGAEVSLDGYSILQGTNDGSGFVANGTSYSIPDGFTIPDGGFFVISGADLSFFNSEWSVTLTEDQFDGSGGILLNFGAGYAYALDNGSRAIIDETIEVGVGERIYQESDNNWVTETPATSTPGGFGGDPPLPVTLTAFTATYVQNNFVVYVSWTTESEAAMNCYNLYRAEAENDSQMEVYSVNATNTTQTHTYQFEDTEISAETTYYYWLEAVGNDGTTQHYGPTSVTIEGEVIPELPSQTYLHGNFPNPFNPETVIKFDVKENDTAKLIIYNIKGEEVMQKTFQPGEHEFTWNATVSSGVYFYKLTSETYTRTKKMLLLK